MKKTVSKFIFVFAFSTLFAFSMLATDFSTFPQDENGTMLPPPPPGMNQSDKTGKMTPPGKLGNPGSTPGDAEKQFNGIIKVTSGKKTIENQTIESDKDGMNTIFVSGNKTVVNVSNVKISTKQNGSRGLYAACGGTINASDVEITTKGEHCAAFATDMGEGNVSVENAKAETSGRGSPVIYSTGKISVKNIAGSAKNSEIAVIEGKNSLSIENSVLSGEAGLDDEVSAGIMVYQSMSGDAGIGTAVLSLRNSSLTNTADGPFIYCTNTSGIINLSKTKIENKSGIFLQASGNESRRGWGEKGANGAEIELNAENQEISGEIKADKISSLKINLKDGAKFSGFVDSAKNGTADIKISKNASLEFTEDSYFNKFSASDSSFKNIKSNGHTIFYNKNNKENAKFKGKTISLDDGGKLVPTKYETVKIEKKSVKNRPPRPEPNGFSFGTEPPRGF